MNKLEQNYQELESILSPDIHLYLDYFFTTNKRNTSSSVSYTHLDVYKRQDQDLHFNSK